MPQNPRPTGDLEHLFRQTFAEAEIQPRTNLWEQLDHEMVVEQNDTYRRRLVVHRWVAAACLLLALGFGTWATLRQWQKGAPELVAASGKNASTSQSGLGSANSASGAITQDQQSSGVATAPNQGTDNGEQLGAASETDNLLAAAGLGQSGAYNEAPAGAAGNVYASASASGDAGEVAYQSGRLSSYAAASRAGTYGRSGSGSDGGVSYGFASQGQYAASSGADNLMGMSYLSSRLRSSLGLGLPDTLKPSLLSQPVPAAAQMAAITAPEEEKPQTPKLWHRLRVGGTYAASAYNPNINFSKADGQLRADAVTLALNSYYRDDAETEYRRNLRAGLGQRVALTIDYALSKKLSVSSGVEVAEQRATSATSYGFIDGKQVRSTDMLFNAVPAYAYSRAPLVARATSYRYRSAGVPVTVRYGSVKAGASLYAKVGAAVNVLLNSRSELEGSPEATRTYTLSSSDSPYRKVMATVRGGAGVRYQPATARWNVAIGPVAEAGLTTLNAHPNQSTLRQSRPYSLGLEASVEFGSARPVVALH